MDGRNMQVWAFFEGSYKRVGKIDFLNNMVEIANCLVCFEDTDLQIIYILEDDIKGVSIFGKSDYDNQKISDKINSKEKAREILYKQRDKIRDKFAKTPYDIGVFDFQMKKIDIELDRLNERYL